MSVSLYVCCRADEDTAERAPFTGINLRSARSVGSLPIPDSAYEKVKSSIVLLERLENNDIESLAVSGAVSVYAT